MSKLHVAAFLFAYIRLFTGVCEEMFFQVLPRRQAFRTIWALEFFHAYMAGFDVAIEVQLVTVSFVALWYGAWKHSDLH